MIALIAAVSISLASSPIRIIFVGNSHTYVNDLPAMVKGLLESDGRGRSCSTRLVTVEFLNEASPDEMNLQRGAWDVIVLQGATLSSSHTRTYPNDRALQLAVAAKRSGARTLMFVEWPREGWDESDWQFNSYREIFKSSGAELVDVPHVFDVVHARFPKVSLWQADGNHAQAPGTFIAAACIYRWIVGVLAEYPSYVAPGVPADFARFAEAQARRRYIDLGGR